MAQQAATMDRKGSAAGTAKPPRKRAAKGAGAKAATGTSGERQPAASPAPGLPGRALRAGLLTSALALLGATIVMLVAGHAPSWRSLKVVCLQAVPLLPGIALAWWLLEVLRARFPALPLAFWMGLAFVGTVGVMLVAPGIVFALMQRTAAFAEDHDGEMGLLNHVLGFGGGLYLYATTAFRLWWPYGLALPLVVSGLVWQAFRHRT